MNKNVFSKMIKSAGAPADCRSLQALAAFVRANVPEERSRALQCDLGACGRLSRERHVALPGHVDLHNFGGFGVFPQSLRVLGGYHFGGDTLIAGDLEVSGELVSAGYQVVTGDLEVSGDLVVAGDLVVYGRTTVSGRVTGPGCLSAFGGLVTPGPLEVAEATLCKGSWAGGGITTRNLLVKGTMGTYGSPSDWV